MYLPLDIFITFQTESIVYRNVTNEIHQVCCTDLWFKHLQEEYPTVDFKSHLEYLISSKKREMIIVPKIELLLNISLILVYYNLINTDDKINLLKILIYFNYFLCWLFVLIVSVQTLNFEHLNEVLENTWINTQILFMDNFSIN
jgi:hypothetical protein